MSHLTRLAVDTRLAKARLAIARLTGPEQRDRGEGALQTTVITVSLLALAIAVAAAITAAVNGRLPGIF